MAAMFPFATIAARLTNPADRNEFARTALTSVMGDPERIALHVFHRRWSEMRPIIFAQARQ